jgi:polyphosphate kinase 2 (PPK2 family)
VAFLAPHAAPAAWPSSTAPGTAACWSSASRASAPRNDWLRAYSEINDFEHELVRSRRHRLQVLAAISQEEQLKRFKEREKIEFKRFKITEEDWRNREKWDAYQRRSATWSTAPAPASRRGPWSKPTTRPMRA